MERGSNFDMGKQLNGKQILNWVLIILLVLSASAVQFFIWNTAFNKRVIGYEKQITTLKATLSNVGELVDIYTVRTESFPGKLIAQEDLEPVQIPASFAKDSYVLDPSSVVGKFYKIAVKPGTPLTEDLIMEDKLDDTDREMDIVANSWPSGLKEGDYVDFEITYPFGEKYIVLSHKRVKAINGTALKMILNGTERHLYSGALVDYFLHSKEGASMDMVKYPEPGAQQKAQIYYAIPKNILAVILADPNVVSKVDAAINAQRRALIETGLSIVTDTVGGTLAGGRAEVTSKINGAVNTFTQTEKERLEKEAYDALEKAGEQPAPGASMQQPTTNEDLKVNDGVVN